MKLRKMNVDLYSLTICGIGLILMFLPLTICFVNSFRTTNDLLRGFLAVPEALTLENYGYIIREKQALRYLGNSLAVTTSGVLISVLINPFVAYMIAVNWHKRGYRVLYTVLSACMFIPGNLLLFPLIKIFYSLKLMNVYGLLLYYAAIYIPETVFMLVPYFRTFNQEIGEAAQLDGCSPLQMYYRIFLPVCKPFVITIMILNAIWMWNDFLMPLMILNKDPETWTIPIFIYNFLGRNSFKKNYAFASCQLALMPIVLFYGVFHRSIISGLNMKFQK